MVTKPYVPCVLEIDRWLKYFSQKKNAREVLKKLLEEKNTDILEFRCPPKWQKE